MKALDKVFDTQVITGIIGDRISFHWSKENFLYEEGRKQTERQYQSYNCYRRKSNRIYQSQSEWNTDDVSSYKLWDSIDFNLTGKFLD